jgi:rubrerythrin
VAARGKVLMATVKANRRVTRERSLAVKRPDLVGELHPTRNPDLDTQSLALWSRQKVWWRCRECGNEWMTEPGSRAKGAGCPACGRRRNAAAASHANGRVPPQRSLAVRRPELAAELHPTLNEGLHPFALAAYSSRAVWWLCPGCGSEWLAAPNARGKAGRCPSCR